MTSVNNLTTHFPIILQKEKKRRKVFPYVNN